MKKIVIIVSLFLIISFIGIYYTTNYKREKELNQNSDYINYASNYGYDINATPPNKSVDRDEKQQALDTGFDTFVLHLEVLSSNPLYENKLGLSLYYIPIEEEIKWQYSLVMYLDNPNKIYYSQPFANTECILDSNGVIVELVSEDCSDSVNVTKDRFYLEEALQLIKKEFDILNNFNK